MPNPVVNWHFKRKTKTLKIFVELKSHDVYTIHIRNIHTRTLHWRNKKCTAPVQRLRIAPDTKYVWFVNERESQRIAKEKIIFLFGYIYLIKYLFACKHAYIETVLVYSLCRFSIILHTCNSIVIWITHCTVYWKWYSVLIFLLCSTSYYYFCFLSCQIYFHRHSEQTKRRAIKM